MADLSWVAMEVEPAPTLRSKRRLPALNDFFMYLRGARFFTFCLRSEARPLANPLFTLLTLKSGILHWQWTLRIAGPALRSVQCSRRVSAAQSSADQIQSLSPTRTHYREICR